MTTTTDPWLDRLSEYVDGDLDDATRRELEAHLEVCATCQATRDELLRVVARARATAYREPTNDLWPKLEASLGPTLAKRPRRPRVVSFTMGRLALAAGIVAMIAAGLAWTIATRQSTSPTPDVATIPPAVRPAAPSAGLGPAALAVASYREAVSDLERALAAGRGTLRPETMQVIEANLRSIDVAIAQADSALRQDPGSEYLNQYLVSTMQRKLKLLRHAVAITSPRT